MKAEVRLAIATAVLQGIVAHHFDGNECNGFSLLGAKEAARLALEYADALLEAARPSPAPARDLEEPPQDPPRPLPASGEDSQQNGRTPPQEGARRAREIADGIQTA